jgi:23S rRNA (cytidine1920-2'-O)/16S rRNA (cytidine1409-2'-O)-methyltransferase
MTRADLLLATRGLAPTRSAAQRLIERGAVQRQGAGQWVVLRKSGEDLADDCELRITDDAELRWVSRAGLKLDAALARTGLAVHGAHCLDAGQGTGGFTEVLLARGAARVVGVDVGHGQLHHSLREHAQVHALEGVNARALTREALGAAMPEAGFDLVVADLSFIPLTTVLPALVPLLAAGGTLLVLVKPQFELQPQDIGKGGLVKHAASYAEVERKLREACGVLGLRVAGWMESAVTGGDGNREFFVWAVRDARPLERTT